MRNKWRTSIPVPKWLALFGIGLISFILFSVVSALAANYSHGLFVALIACSALSMVFAFVSLVGALLRVILGPPREFVAGTDITMKPQKFR